jgi:hypothetical protein
MLTDSLIVGLNDLVVYIARAIPRHETRLIFATIDRLTSGRHCIKMKTWVKPRDLEAG